MDNSQAGFSGTGCWEGEGESCQTEREEVAWALQNKGYKANSQKQLDKSRLIQVVRASQQET